MVSFSLIPTSTYQFSQASFGDAKKTKGHKITVATNLSPENAIHHYAKRRQEGHRAVMHKIGAFLWNIIIVK